jgi:hypothetical protein
MGYPDLDLIALNLAAGFNQYKSSQNHKTEIKNGQQLPIHLKTKLIPTSKRRGKTYVNSKVKQRRIHGNFMLLLL